MASIYKEFTVDTHVDRVWNAIKDIGSVHTRLARGFVIDTKLAGDTRTVTFANGFVVQEQILAIDDAHRRLAYRAIGGRASHHNAYFQVFAGAGNTTRIMWVTDLLPDDAREPIAQMVEQGAQAIRRTLEQT